MRNAERIGKHRNRKRCEMDSSDFLRTVQPGHWTVAIDAGDHDIGGGNCEGHNHSRVSL